MESFQTLSKNFMFLGIPFGESKFIKEHLDNKINTLENQLDLLLNNFQSNQVIFQFLSKSLSICRLTFSLRNLDPFTNDFKEQTIKFDKYIQRAIEALISSSLSKSQMSQASLPRSLCGLGIRTAEMTHRPAYTASLLASSEQIKQLSPNFQIPQDVHSYVKTLKMDANTPITQRNICQTLEKSQFKLLYDSSTLTSKAWLLP